MQAGTPRVVWAVMKAHARALPVIKRLQSDTRYNDNMRIVTPLRLQDCSRVPGQICFTTAEQADCACGYSSLLFECNQETEETRNISNPYN